MEVKHLPAMVAISCLWLSLIVLFVAILAMNSGHMVYTIDDIYIHLAISRNLNEYSVFGVTRYEFSSSSSSPFWTLIISAGFVLVGVNDMLPLALNAILASVAVVTVYALLKDMDVSPRYLTVVLLSFVFFTSLPGLVFTGMEHILHIVLSLIFIVLSSRILSSEESTGRQLLLLLVVTLLVSAVRFESMFLAIPVALLFSMKRKWSHALTVLGMAAFPWIAYGVVSVQNGWLLLPNSLLVKGVDAINHGIGWFLVRGIGSLAVSPHLLVLLFASVKLPRFQDQGFWHIDNVMRLIFISSCLMHLQLGRVGWFFRYEAYLVALGVFTVSIQGRQFFSELDLTSLRIPAIDTSLNKNRLYGLGLIGLFIAPLAGRGALWIYWTPIASNNIYDQHYQMALFLDKFYTGEAVLMNDIGFANYLSDIVCIDKWGIGTLDVGQSLLNGSMSVDTLRIIAAEHGVKVAILHPDGLVPEEWEVVGYWTIRDNVVAYNSTVAFLVVMPSERERLIDSLVQFSSGLSEDVIEGGLYTTLVQ
ncbi:MAG: hypothetical protein ACXADO_05245 [Candidatus Thorarchaeota archaeon]|jgi:hypothetical protein